MFIHLEKPGCNRCSVYTYSLDFNGKVNSTFHSSSISLIMDQFSHAQLYCCVTLIQWGSLVPSASRSEILSPLEHIIKLPLISVRFMDFTCVYFTRLEGCNSELVLDFKHCKIWGNLNPRFDNSPSCMNLYWLKKEHFGTEHTQYYFFINIWLGSSFPG